MPILPRPVIKPFNYRGKGPIAKIGGTITIPNCSIISLNNMKVYLDSSLLNSFKINSIFAKLVCETINVDNQTGANNIAEYSCYLDYDIGNDAIVFKPCPIWTGKINLRSIRVELESMDGKDYYGVLFKKAKYIIVEMMLSIVDEGCDPVEVHDTGLLLISKMLVKN